MKVPKLTRMGFCHVCETWHEIAEGTSCLPVHNAKESEEKCRNSQYSPSQHKYLVETDEKALSLARFLAEDDGRCLFGTRHSMNCRDGDNCDEERRRLARALAVYFLEHII